MVEFIDTHAHMHDSAFENDIDEVVKKRDIRNCFRGIRGKTNDFTKIADVQWERINYNGEKIAFCSLLLFSSKAIPSFMQNLDDAYKKKECYIGYALILEIEDYVIIFSRHANGMNEFKNKQTHYLLS